MKGKGGKTAPTSYLVEAVVLAKSPLTGTLSYFSGTRLVPGTLVKVPVRNSLTPALVLSSKGVRDVKSTIRRAGYVLRKIRQADIMEAVLSSESVEALKVIARYYTTSLGTLASLLLPKLMLERMDAFFPPQDPKKYRPLPRDARETVLLQMEHEERLGQYRAIVRQSFAREASVIFVVPTRFDAERIREELSKGITEFVHIFTLEEKPSDAERIWKRALEEKHPVLFITTPAGLLFPRADVDTLIIERVNSRAWRTIARPFADMRFAAETLAKHRQLKLVMGDSVLPIETLWREKQGEFGEMSLVRWRLPAVPTRVVDARAKQEGGGRFEIFSAELREFIHRALDEEGKIFLFSVRTGLAPTTVCGDCGTVLPCKNCGAPVVLHQKKERTLYVCHACNATRESLTSCANCGGWRLFPLGIGLEEISRQIKDLFPEIPVHLLDKEHAGNDTKAKSIMRRFDTEGGILVGTELAFFHLERVPYTAVVSLDSLFSVPDFHTHERIFYLVNRLREVSRRECLIQTRNIGKHILGWAAQGNISDFYQNEIKEREELAYPPFSVFIKIGSEDRTNLTNLAEQLMAWGPEPFRDSLIIRLPRTLWPDEELSQKLSLLGPGFSIKVDPESLL